jgi:hypothetical protein
MITFIISCGEVEKTYEYSTEDNINRLKMDIIKDFELSCDYIDLNITIERAIRVLGKFNMSPGILPRSMDTYQFNRYGIDDKTISAEFVEVKDYKPFISKRPTIKKTEPKKTDNKIFNLNSEEDFPSL